MKNIKIEKVTLNIGVGAPGDKLDKAKLLLETISKSKPCLTSTSKRIPTWGLRPGLDIGTKVTLRGKKAKELLFNLLKAKSNILKASNFDIFGNLSFGISEYIDIPGVEYNLEIGIIGLEVAVTLERPGFRIKKRRIKRSKIPKNHLINRQEAIDYMKETFKINIEELKNVN